MDENSENTGDSTGQVILKALGHHDALVDGLWRLLLSGQLLDFDSKLAGRPARAHALMLAAFLSPEKLSPSGHDHQYSSEPPLPDDGLLNPLLEFLYRGTVSVPEGQLEGLLGVARELDFSLLIDAVERASREMKDEESVDEDLYEAEVGQVDEDDPEWQPETDRPAAKRRRESVPVQQETRRAKGGGGRRFRLVLSTAPGELVPGSDCEWGGGDDDEDGGGGAGKSENKLAVVRRGIRRRRRKQSGVATKREPKSFVDPKLGLSKSEWQRAYYANLPLLHCELCQYQTRSEKRIKLHQAKHDPSIPVFRCDLCSCNYLTQEKLDRHRARHTTYQCPHCDFQTDRQPAFYQHLYSRHRVNTANQPLRQSCSDCDFTCVLPCQLRRHWIRRHSNEKNFKCELCDYASVARDSVIKHYRNAHLNIKTFCCEICGSRSATRYHLERHRRTHAGSALQQAVDSLGQMASDDPNVLLQLGEAKPFQCHICGHACSRKDNLKVHIKNVHKIVT